MELLPLISKENNAKYRHNQYWLWIHFTKRGRKSPDISESGLSDANDEMSYQLAGISWLSDLFSATAAFIDEYGFKGRLVGLYFYFSFFPFSFFSCFSHFCLPQFVFFLICFSFLLVCFLLPSSLSYPIYVILVFPVDMRVSPEHLPWRTKPLVTATFSSYSASPLKLTTYII
jgi:hypothetical protein